MGKTAPPFLLTDSVLGIEATVFYYFLIVVQLLSLVQLLVIPWTAVHQASLSFTNSLSFQTHVHRITDAIQPSHPLPPPSPPALSLSQHHSLFQRASSLHLMAKELEIQHQSFQ